MKRFLFEHVFSSLGGITAGRWCQLLWQYRGKISPRYWPRASWISLLAGVNSVRDLAARALYRHQLQEVSIPAPVFVVGHWRSGTTWLHQLLAQDRRFTFSSMEQSFFPLQSLLGGWLDRLILKLFMPKTRGVDAMPMKVGDPMEDEFALLLLTGFSPYLEWTFPNSGVDHRPYLSLKNIDEDRRDLWKAALRLLVGQLVLQRPGVPLLKSPPHTARLEILRQVFPNAIFIHVHRQPEKVFSSMRRLALVGTRSLRLQCLKESSVNERILGNYEELYEHFLCDRSHVLGERFFELRYERLVANPQKMLEEMYDHFGWSVEAGTREGWDQLIGQRADYQPNVFAPLAEPISREIARRWYRFYHEFSG